MKHLAPAGLRSLALLAALVAVGGAAGGCGSTSTTDLGCETNADCALAGTRCDTTAKRCVCAIDEACDEGRFCNSLGVCQLRAGCVRTADCGENAFCDSASGQCLSGPSGGLGTLCGTTDQCPYGTLCTVGTCQVGCFDDGDCRLGEICFEGACATGDGICSTNEFCDYREVCDGNACRLDRRGPYCRGCSPRTMANPNPCEDPRNFCLINNLETGGFTSFCGVDCSGGQACPNGYDCNRIIVLTDDVCGSNADCRCQSGSIRFATATCTVAAPCVPRRADGSADPQGTRCLVEREPSCNGGLANGGNACIVPRGETVGNCLCGTDADCGDGGTCVDGLCCTGPIQEGRECRIGENRTAGFCSCATDDDCPRDACDATRGVCAITGRPCAPGQGDCGPIACVEGGCLIGNNCAPIQGLSCSVVGP